MNKFHLSLPCKSVEVTKRFYVNSLKLDVGREAYNWVDINVFGNQITFAEKPNSIINTGYYSLDSKRLPIFHIGIILDADTWKEQLSLHSGKHYFEIDPTTFMQDKVGEHDSFFIQDPNGYYLEFKTFNNPEEIFKRRTTSISD